MGKIFVLDTNVLLYDSQSLFAFKDNSIVIHYGVLHELDTHKERQDEVGRNARMAIRHLDELRSSGNIIKGVPLPSGGEIKISGVNYQIGGRLSVDDAIIKLARDMKRKVDREVILVTKDVCVRVKCDAQGISCADYLKHRMASDADELYKGVTRIQVPKSFIEEFYATGILTIPQDVLETTTLQPNQFLVVKDLEGTGMSAITRFVSIDNPIAKRLISVPSGGAWGLRPRNKEQEFAFDLLLDDKLSLVTLIGAAGTGKTLLAAAAGIHQTLEEQKFKKIIIVRPVCPVGKDIGFLPGTMEEKLEPWVAPVMDNLKFLFGVHGGKGKKHDDSMLQMYIENGVIEVEAMTYIRGRSIPNAYIIIDECQNLTAHELKTIVTRVGDGSKIVLTGDIEQIDNTYVDAVSNGLTYAVEKFKEFTLAGHVTLLKGERSQLATLASKIL